MAEQQPAAAQRPRINQQRKRQVEVFSAGCLTCNDAVRLVQDLADEFDAVQILDMQDEKVATLAKSLGVTSVPAVMITAPKLAPCCANGAGPDEAILRRAGVGRPIANEQRKRQIEIFSAGCNACQEAIEIVRRIACRSCEVTVHDMNDRNVARVAKSLGIRQVPAILITASELAACCSGHQVDEAVLRKEGIGQPVQRQG